MKANGVLLNTSRGNVVKDEDLLAHMNAHDDFWYGTDVFNGEPTAKAIDWKSDISTHPRCYGTHHCGASTQQAEAAIGVEAVRIVMKYRAEGMIDAMNWVNKW